MIVTPLKVIHLPADYAEKLDYQRRNLNHVFYFSAVEYVAGLRGESVSHLYHDLFNLESKQGELCNIDSREVTIESESRERVSAPRALLIRHFHFFEDFFGEFPEETNIKAPFTTGEVLGAASFHTFERRLIDCYECLSYFNPKDPLHFLTLDTKGASEALLVKLVGNLTRSNRRDLLEARRLLDKYGQPAPFEGEGIGVISYVLEVNQDFEHIASLFSECPSYLAYALDNERSRTLLSTADFSKEIGTIDKRITIILSVRVMEVLETGESIEQARRLLAMLKIKDERLGNKDYKNVAPYHSQLNPSYVNLTRAIPNLAQVFELPIEVLRSILCPQMRELH